MMSSIDIVDIVALNDGLPDIADKNGGRGIIGKRIDYVEIVIKINSAVIDFAIKCAGRVKELCGDY